MKFSNPMPLFKTILKDKAVYFITERVFELNGETWQVIGLEIKDREWIYTVRNGDDIHEVTEKQIVERHKKHGITIPVMPLNEAMK